MKKIFLPMCLWVVLLAACGRKMPKDVITTDQMERILYDYHLSNAMQSTVGHNDNVKKEALRRYVFSKHGVTEEQFDSSMVWYTRHPEELATIYKNLEERFRSQSDHVAQLLSSREEGMTLSLPGDTVDMWHGDAYYRLEARSPLYRMLTFTMAADSNFQANDAIRWTARFDFAKDSRTVARMGLSIKYDNDSVAGEVKNVSRSGEKSIYIPQDSAYRIRSINGFVYVPADAASNAEVLVHGVQLMRYHVPFDSTMLQKPKADSLKTDTARVGMDTLKSVPEMPGNVPMRRTPGDFKKGPHKSARPAEMPKKTQRRPNTGTATGKNRPTSSSGTPRKQSTSPQRR